MNHYDLLEVSPKASPEVIRAAYKSLMQRNHPDRHADADGATARSARIAQAYEVLGDPARRAVYDASLQPVAQALGPPGGRSQHPGLARPPATPARSWYIPLLLSCIVLSGVTILWMPKKGARPEARVDTRPGAPASAAGAGNAPPVSAGPGQQAPARQESPAELQARTISGFVTQLSVDLGPADPAKPGSAHVLSIPTLGLRLAVEDPARWVRKIQAERPRIIQQLLGNLAGAQYIELIGAEGDLYLRKLIEDTVTQVVGLDAAPLPLAASAVQPAPRRLEALLPLSFAVR